MPYPKRLIMCVEGEKNGPLEKAELKFEQFQYKKVSYIWIYIGATYTFANRLFPSLTVQNDIGWPIAWTLTDFLESSLWNVKFHVDVCNEWTPNTFS